MPNYCSNSVTITAQSHILEEINDACEKGEFLKFCKNYDDWDYGMFIETYGTKWEPNIIDVSMDVDTQQIHIIMDTAWSPPTGAYDLLLDMEGVDDIHAYFSEPGCDFVGFYSNGFEESMEITYIADKVMRDETLSVEEQDLYDYCEGEVEYIIEMKMEEILGDKE